MFVSILPTEEYETSDELLFDGHTTIDVETPLILNISTPGLTGYYGSFRGSTGPVRLSIIETDYVDDFVLQQIESALFTIENETMVWWEYPCRDSLNISLVYQTVYSEPNELSYLVQEDATPPVVSVVSARLSVYPPIYQLDFQFSGGFFSRAIVILPNTTRNGYLYANGTVDWYAYKMQDNGVAVFPDGVYNVTIRVFDDMNQETEHYHLIQKTTGATSTILALVIIGVFSSAVVAEYLRRQRFGE